MLLEYDAGGTASFSPQLKLVPGQELGQAGEVELHAIPPGQGGQRFEIGWSLPGQEWSQLPEVPGKGARGNHLQKPDWASARVPEGVKDPAPLEDRLSHPGYLDPVALL